MATFYSDVKPLSNYSPVMLHLSPATRIRNENPGSEWSRITDLNLDDPKGMHPKIELSLIMLGGVPQHLELDWQEHFSDLQTPDGSEI